MLLIASMGVLVRQFSCCMFSLFSGVMMILIVKICCLLGLSVGPTDCRRSVARSWTLVSVAQPQWLTVFRLHAIGGRHDGMWTYSRDQLCSLNRNEKPARYSVRKAIFAHRLWQPRRSRLRARDWLASKHKQCRTISWSASTSVLLHRLAQCQITLQQDDNSPWDDRRQVPGRFRCDGDMAPFQRPRQPEASDSGRLPATQANSAFHPFRVDKWVVGCN